MTPKQNKKSSVHETACEYLALGSEVVGKTEARQRFLPLVNDLQTNPRTVEITDRDQTVAVLLNYQHYLALLAKSKQPIGKVKPNLSGSIKILGDLEQGDKEISQLFEQSIKRSANQL